MSPSQIISVLLLVAYGFCLTPPVAILAAATPAAGQPASATQLLEQGKNLYRAGEFQPAAEVLAQAAHLYQSRGDALNQALALSYLSLAYQKLGQLSEAGEASATSLSLLTPSDSRSADSQRIRALALNVRGSLQLAQGQTEEALATWKQAAEAYGAAGDRHGRTGSQINQATALQALGQYRQAVKLLQQLEETLQAQPNSPLKAAGLRSLGNALRFAGNLDKSQQLLEQSLAIAQELQSRQEESETLLSLGSTALAFARRVGNQQDGSSHRHLPVRCPDGGIPPDAQSYYNKAEGLYHKSAEKSTSNLTQIQAQLNRLSVLLAQQQTPTAEELRDLRQQIERLSPSRPAVYARVNFAGSLICLQQESWGAAGAPLQNPAEDLLQTQAIAQLLGAAVQQAKDLKDERAESYAAGNLGQLYEVARELPVAVRHTEAALNLAQSIGAPDIAYQWQWQLGRLRLALGDRSGALEVYAQAVATLKSLRSDLAALNPDIQFDFRDRVEPVYRQLVALLLESEQPAQENLKRARDTIEALQLAELDNFFRDACLNAKPKQIDEIADSSNPKAAVIYPIVLADRTEVILKLPNQNELRHYRVRLAKSQVESTLEQLRSNLTKPYALREVKSLSEQVYSWLVAPALPDLNASQVKTLVFVLDSPFRNIPMAALYDGERYLVENYSIALAPGLQLLSPKPLHTGRLEALAAGVTEPRSGFPALPNVERELQEIKSEVRSRILFNEEFTSKALQERVSDLSFPVIHLATHGQFSSNASDTFIVAWDKRIYVKELDSLLRTGERSSTEGIELLVLSACQTAAGDRRAALGLAGVAVRAGARSTLASLWSVDDESTALLMSQFYRELASNQLTKAEALRQAQLGLLKNPKYQRPLFWAPYVLVGNWL
ncbi:CHAT domain-containing protein [Kamptonema formosum]|uniref:CHAT domain-containing protein n=1 Tax=Kamptonema formosum TaxID=331992 RepID=UPI0003462E0F|nr:CHAT domain-containing protein [Oscillatoria sp. PCC 10802]